MSNRRFQVNGAVISNVSVILWRSNSVRSTEWALEALKCKPDSTSDAQMISCLSKSWEMLIAHFVTVGWDACKRESRMRCVPGKVLIMAAASYSSLLFSRIWQRKLGILYWPNQLPVTRHVSHKCDTGHPTSVGRITVCYEDCLQSSVSWVVLYTVGKVWMRRLQRRWNRRERFRTDGEIPRTSLSRWILWGGIGSRSLSGSFGRMELRRTDA